MSEKIIAVDLGGTNVRGVVIDAHGSISSRISRPTPDRSNAVELLDTFAQLVGDLKGQADDIGVVSVAAAAVLDKRDARKTKWPNIPALADVDFPAEIEKRTGLKVLIENDATAAAIGEHWLGAAKGSEHAICITLGTGVGGGIISNGKPVFGAIGTAGEIGHICLDINGPKCGCGSNGCLEQYSSGTAIVRIVRELFEEFPDSTLRSRSTFEPKDVFEAGKSGDTASVRAFEIAGTSLGTALAGLINVLDPEVIVITGGVAAAWELFIEATWREVRYRAFQQPAENVKIVRGALGDDAGVIGAARRAFQSKGFS